MILTPKEVAALVKDAERYRWLKDHISPANPGRWAHYVGCWTVNTLDAVIDAAIAKATGGE